MDAAHETNSQTHPFEDAGFKAPYTMQGFSGPLEGSFNAFEGNTSMLAFEPQYGGTCDICGQCIVDMTHFVDATGKKFHTGCDCAELANLSDDEIAYIRKQQKDARRARRLERGRPEREAHLAAFRAKQNAARAELNSVDFEALATFAPEDDEDYWAGKSAADDVRGWIRRNDTRLDVVVSWIDALYTELEAGERGEPIAQPDFAVSTACELGRQDMALRFVRQRGNDPAIFVDRQGRVFKAWNHPEISETEFTAVRATVKSSEQDRYLQDATVSFINRIALRS